MIPGVWVNMRKAEQLGLFGPAPKHVAVVKVKGHTRHTSHGAVVVAPHIREVEKLVPVVHLTPSRIPSYAPSVATTPPGGTMKTETRIWRGEAQGYKTGDTAKFGAEWVVITSAKKARTRKLTEHDEDAGHGQEGDTQTTQEVTYRVATADEATAAETKKAKKAADKQTAAQKADPRFQAERWAEEHGAVALPEYGEREKEIRALNLTWSNHTIVPPINMAGGSRWFKTAVGPDGALFGRWGHSNYDDGREIYYEVPAEDHAARRAVEVAHQQEQAVAAEAARQQRMAETEARIAEMRAEDAAAEAAKALEPEPEPKKRRTTVLVTGNTYPVREKLKALGATWDGKNKGWRVPSDKADAAQRLVK